MEKYLFTLYTFNLYINEFYQNHSKINHSQVVTNLKLFKFVKINLNNEEKRDTRQKIDGVPGELLK